MELALSKHSAADLKPLEDALGRLHGAEAAQILAAAADVALVLDRDGVIRSVTFGNADLALPGTVLEVGRSWAETVTDESRSKVQALMNGAMGSEPPKWRQVNHPSPHGVDLPIRYFAVSSDPTGKVVAIGRDLRAMAAMQQRLLDSQHTMEREYSRLRQSETRYRLLFQVSARAVLIVNARTQKIVEGNPAASDLLGMTTRQLVGKSFPDMFANDYRDTIQTLMAGGRAEDLRVRLVDGDRHCLLSASTFRQDNTTYLLARLAPQDDGVTARLPRSGVQCLRVIESLPEGFVVTDSGLGILSSNNAFLDLTQIAAADQAIGQPLTRFIGRTQVDLNVLVSNLRQHGVVRQFKTVLQDSYGTDQDVEISAVHVSEGDQPCFGFTIRPIGVTAGSTSMASDLPRSVEQLTKLVGRVSLKEIVRDTTDMIERLCIEAALELTQDNRASAAELLGLSRQGLYAKLRRYNIVE